MAEKTEIKLRLSSLADLTGGELRGEDREISGICVPEDQREGAVCILAVKKAADLASGAAAAYIIPKDLKVETGKPVIIVEDTRPALVKILRVLYPEKPVEHNISKLASVSAEARLVSPVEICNFVTIGAGSSLGANTRVGHNCVIGRNVSIGENCVIYPNVTIYDDITLGNNVIIHSGAVIGADGFGFIPGENPVKIPQKGSVILEDFVEIGANSCIDRGTIGATVIGFGTKIDDLVMVGHNTKIGRCCLIASQVGFSGSIETGDFVVAAGQVGFADHIKIASGSVFGGQAGVPNDIKEKGNYLGAPCIDMIKYARAYAVFKELPELRRRVANLEKQSD